MNAARELKAAGIAAASGLAQFGLALAAFAPSATNHRMGAKPFPLFPRVNTATFLLFPFDARPVVRSHRLDWGLLRRRYRDRIHLRSDSHAGNRVQVLEIYREQLSKLCLAISVKTLSLAVGQKLGLITVRSPCRAVTRVTLSRRVEMRAFRVTFFTSSVEGSRTITFSIQRSSLEFSKRENVLQ
jgi:hypothetical protein